MCREGIYPYEYMADREKFNETLLPEKEDLYNHLKIWKVLPKQIMGTQKDFV